MVIDSDVVAEQSGGVVVVRRTSEKPTTSDVGLNLPCGSTIMTLYAVTLKPTKGNYNDSLFTSKKMVNYENENQENTSLDQEKTTVAPDFGVCGYWVGWLCFLRSNLR